LRGEKTQVGDRGTKLLGEQGVSKRNGVENFRRRVIYPEFSEET